MRICLFEKGYDIVLYHDSIFTYGDMSTFVFLCMLSGLMGSCLVYGLLFISVFYSY